VDLNVLLVTAEADPFAKVGGLADVAGSLPGALRRLGVDARVLMPGFGFIPHDRYSIEHLFKFDFPHRTGSSEVHVYGTEFEGVPYYFLQVWPYFGQENTVYTDWSWDSPRYILFNQIAMAAAWELRGRLGWFPDVFHVNDWHTGLLPFMINAARHDPVWQPVGTMLTIHNMAYQGDRTGGWMWNEGIPGRNHFDLEIRGLSDNILGIAIAYSDVITTVSPRYAIEIQYPSMGYGLDDLLRTRVRDLRGILNGIDVARWNPATDPALVQNFTADNFEELRVYNKRQLQIDAALPVRDDVPVIGIVSRLVWQKGIDMALPALYQLLSETDVQFVGLGSGEPSLSHAMWLLEQHFPGKARAFVGFDAALAQRIYAGVDVFLMPSRYEPCGTGQMMAMRYGALPLVRETGGLADTVHNFDNAEGESGTGFVFLWEESEAILNTLRWSLETYRRKPGAWQRMQKRAMQTDFSWDTSARAYLDLYERAVIRHRG
jgi:starch synthase